jgi:hypothetical protein
VYCHPKACIGSLRMVTDGELGFEMPKLWRRFCVFADQ